MAVGVVAGALLGGGWPAGAATAPQAVPFAQEWANAGLITISDDWSGVPGVIGYRGDGLTSANAGLLMQGREEAMVPCTPAGVMELLGEAGVELEGARAVVLGRSILVGKPVAQLLLGANATVTHCHSRTRDLPAVCREAEVLIAAVGSPRLVTADMVSDGAVVIDVGTNRTSDGLVGDVDYAAVKEKAAAITPVPGGVGPMTRAMLLVNTLRAAQRASR